jgi:hypothetical protein
MAAPSVIVAPQPAMLCGMCGGKAIYVDRTLCSGLVMYLCTACAMPTFVQPRRFAPMEDQPCR